MGVAAAGASRDAAFSGHSKRSPGRQ